MTPIAKDAKRIFDDSFGPLPNAGTGKDQFNFYKQMGRLIADKFIDDDQKRERAYKQLEKDLSDPEKDPKDALEAMIDQMEQDKAFPKTVKDMEETVGKDEKVLDFTDEQNQETLIVRTQDIKDELAFSCTMATKQNPQKADNVDPSLGFNNADLEALEASVAESVGIEVLNQVIDNFCDRGYEDLAKRLASQDKGVQNQLLLKQVDVSGNNEQNLAMFRDDNGQTVLVNLGEHELTEGKRYKFNQVDDGIEVTAGREIAKTVSKEKRVEREKDQGLGIGFNLNPFK